MNKVDAIIKKVYAELRNRAEKDTYDDYIEMPMAAPEPSEPQQRWYPLVQQVQPIQGAPAQHIAEHAAIFNQTSPAVDRTVVVAGNNRRYSNYLTGIGSRIFRRE